MTGVRMLISGIKSRAAAIATIFGLVVGSLVIGATAAHAAASGEVAVSTTTPIVQESGRTFSYQIDVACSGLNASEACLDARVFIPFDDALETYSDPAHPDNVGDSEWTFDVATGAGMVPVVGAEETVDGVDGYMITFQGGLEPGESTAVRFNIVTETRTTPNGTTWEINPVLTFTADGTPMTERVPAPVTGTVTAEFDYELTKTFSSGRETSFAPEKNSATGEIIYMRLRTIDRNSVAGSLMVSPGEDWVFTDVVPDGLEYREDLSDPDYATAYDAATRTIRTVVPGDVAVPTIYGYAFEVTETIASGETATISNSAQMTARGLAEPEAIERTSTAYVHLSNFTPSAGLFSKTASSNIPRAARFGEVLTDDQTTAEAYYTLSMSRVDLGDYTGRIVDEIPCYDNPVTGGYSSGDVESLCQDVVINVTSLATFGDPSFHSDVDYTLTFADGSTQVVTVPMQNNATAARENAVAVPAGVVAIEAEIDIAPRAAGSTTAVQTYVSFTVPADPRLVDGTLIENRANFWTKTPGTEYGTRSTDDADLIVRYFEPELSVGAQNAYRELDETGSLATGSYLAVYMGAHAEVPPLTPEYENIRSVFLFPSTDTGISLQLTETTLNNAFGPGNWEYFEDYQATGRPALEYTGVSPISRTWPLRFDVEDAVAGVYDYEVYSAVDGYDATSCQRSISSNSSPVELTYPDFWPVSETPVCTTTGTIVLTGPVHAFDIEKEIREDSGSLWMGASSEAIVAPSGSVQYRLSYANVGPAAHEGVVMYDLLPRVGDTGSVAGQADSPRGSTAPAYLTHAVDAPAGFTVAYSTSETPCLAGVNDSIPDCDDDWNETVPSDLTEVTAIRLMADAGHVVETGMSVSAIISVAFADGTEPGLDAWNTVSAGGRVEGQSDNMLSTEAPSVGFTSAATVTPVAPVFNAAETCGVQGTVTIAETEGVVYTETREGDIVTVTASAVDGFALMPGAESSWEITIPAAEPCDVEVTPVAPVFNPAETCGVEGDVKIAETEGIVYTEAREGDVVTVTATAIDGYVLTEGAEVSWVFEIPAVTQCALEPPVVETRPPSETPGIEGAGVVAGSPLAGTSNNLLVAGGAAMVLLALLMGAFLSRKRSASDS